MKSISNSKSLTALSIALLVFVFAMPAEAARREGNGSIFWADGAWHSYYEESADSNSYLDTWDGGFTLRHTDTGVAVIGARGWAVGNYNRKVNFEVGELTTGGNYLVSVYGWFKDYPANLNNGIVEYYVVEHHRGWLASSQKETRRIGREYVNGSWYTYYTSKRYNEDHAFGNGKANFTQYWAIRESKRWSGQVDMPAHFYNWSRHGAPAKDQWGYQMLGIESYKSSGRATARVW